MSSKKSSLIGIGTLIITTKKKLPDSNWTVSNIRSVRKWGVLGTILSHDDSSGLCYEVKHADGSVGSYGQTELRELSPEDEVALMERTQQRITVLCNRIHHQDERIEGEIVDNLLCLGCHKPFTAAIESTEQYEVHCLWRYFLTCLHCTYQSNLAKIKLKDCNCRK